ncbi:MAG: transketolase [Candidatus Taylorbacteria bacterium]|nr:transketolase [Candidatus Taylorbacteria bacterium]
MINEDRVTELKKISNEIRKSLISALAEAGSGHTAGALDMADIFTALYFHLLKHNPKDPLWADRDRLVLSNGHICTVQYSAMAHAGYFPVSELKTLRKFGSRLQGHPWREFLPGIETSSGPLGSGLSQAVGMAIAGQIDTGNRRAISSRRPVQKTIYCLMSDGELNEGNTWEAVMLAAKEKLGNLIAIIDKNGIQIDGFTKDIMPTDSIADKFRSFNWYVEEVDGHDIKAFIDLVEKIKTAVASVAPEMRKPVAIIAKTIPSKGVPEWEGKYEWHGKAPTKAEAEMAIKGLK